MPERATPLTRRSIRRRRCHFHDDRNCHHCAVTHMTAVQRAARPPALTPLDDGAPLFGFHLPRTLLPPRGAPFTPANGGAHAPADFNGPIFIGGDRHAVLPQISREKSRQRKRISRPPRTAPCPARAMHVAAAADGERARWLPARADDTTPRRKCQVFGAYWRYFAMSCRADWKFNLSTCCRQQCARMSRGARRADSTTPREEARCLHAICGKIVVVGDFLE